MVSDTRQTPASHRLEAEIANRGLQKCYDRMQPRYVEETRAWVDSAGSERESARRISSVIAALTAEDRRFLSDES